jgi:hypothetical protein
MLYRISSKYMQESLMVRLALTAAVLLICITVIVQCVKYKHRNTEVPRDRIIRVWKNGISY